MSIKQSDRVGMIHTMTTELSAVIKHHLDQATRTCINCTKFNEPLEQCGLFAARPPARVIALGCEKHEDQIPF